MADFLHTMVRITDPEKSRAFYEALGFTFSRDMDIVRDGQLEATNYFYSLGDAENVLELTFNHDGRTYAVGSGYGHIAIGVDDLDDTLAQLNGQGIQPERDPYRVREGGSRICFVRDPDEYRIELIDHSGKQPLSLHRDFELQPLTDPGDPDDWRPNSIWALVADERADMAVIVEEIGVGDAIPLHRHQIDEVLLYDAGEADVRVDEETYRVGAGDIVIVPAGAAHGTRNVGFGIVRLRAVFPSHRIDLTYLERNPAPGTEADAPQPGAVWDTRSGEVEPL